MLRDLSEKATCVERAQAKRTFMRAVTRALVISVLVATRTLTGAESDADQIRKIYDETLGHSPAHEQLRELTTRFPGRLAGSKNLEQAIPWVERVLRETGCDSVRLQPVTVPHWERGGPEKVLLLPTGGSKDQPIPLTALALGGAVATPEGGLHARVVEVQSLAQVAQLGRDAIAGKIVFFNRPMRATEIRPDLAYYDAGDQRNRGPAEAAKYGAVAALTRSLTHRTDDIPHTGNTGFPPDQPRIPAAALSTVAADRLSAELKQHPDTEVEIQLHSRWLPDAPAFNVIGEIRGSELPDEIILVGGHLDSWDVAPGAHDDGSGVVQSIEVFRLFHALGIRPRHTLRCVLFVAEENSLAGGIEYARVAKEQKEKHIFALETDSGGFEPRGFTIGHTSQPMHERVARWRDLLEPYGLTSFRKGTGGADVGPLLVQGVTVASLAPDAQRYFDYHHTRIDSIDQVSPRELQLGAAALASLIWLVDTQGL